MPLPTYKPAKNTFACELLDRKLALALMSEIPDMGQYAQDWADLAAGFERIGFTFSAADCKARALHYAEIALDEPGMYAVARRGSFSELVRV